MLKKVERSMFFIVTVLVLQQYFVSGDDPIQAFFYQFECYKTEQPGCNEDFIDAYPEFSRSFDNLTLARTRFYLFTPNNQEDPELMHKCGGGLPPNSNFNPKCKTVIFIPGFLQGICMSGIYKELMYQRMKCGCYNYINVDYTWGNGVDLVSAYENSKIVANQTAIVIRLLKERFGLTPSDFMLVGHSLGAHLCGMVGYLEEVDVIHGLDPGGVVIGESRPLRYRLDPSDAKCVQAAHCNAGQCFPQYIGVNYTLGTKEFYFNDGINQYSCVNDMILSFIKGDFIYGLFSLLPAACNHVQCLRYYKTTMCSPDCDWVGVACKDGATFLSGACDDCGPTGEECQLMGFDSCDCGFGGNNKKYFLKTKLDCPYCENSAIKNRDKLQCYAHD